jgi:hypothetical protein
LGIAQSHLEQRNEESYPNFRARLTLLLFFQLTTYSTAALNYREVYKLMAMGVDAALSSFAGSDIFKGRRTNNNNSRMSASYLI